ncbi:methyltransferase [Thermosulfuriphilus ammonigenes]|uniref:Methyltransferase n=1 Tax=Thermosulfuriphilus ammonigenes TaxID=1936021 RepID=A0A6G7PZ72_9BACT|nr:50S ribosomal protein L11 methyltransferase [Thermosulfuriphilus ammonigenes]MBA2849014.1 ribosomal protein L11 methyltransferase [Thermosulfuriphilus ammonigenes]QIJ72703.1 methyltransferase [Thermosulfuriphilus ammonigenes]
MWEVLFFIIYTVMLRRGHTCYRKLYIYGFGSLHPKLHQIDDPDFIGCWEEEDQAVLFFHQPKDDLVTELSKRLGLSLEVTGESDYQDWGTRRRLAPFLVGGRWFVPCWQNWSRPEPTIRYDPSVVFGSGAHPTTRMCLEALARIWEMAPVSTMADLGCGVGLISLLAGHLGAEKVLAVDRNPLCVEVCRANVERNALGKQIMVKLADVLEAELPWRDITVANLYRGLLLELFRRPWFWNGRYYILSGFVPSMEEEIKEGLKKAGCKILWREQQEGWVLLVGEKK